MTYRRVIVVVATNPVITAIMVCGVVIVWLSLLLVVVTLWL